MAEIPSSSYPPAEACWSRLRWSVMILALSLAVPLVHGYHPLAEDGGLYVAGVELTLDPSLFPHFTEFVSAPLQYSIFAPVVAAITRATHLSLLNVLFLLNLFTVALTLMAARALLRRVTSNQRAQLAGIATLAAFWTVPIAGTSLLLMDPYVTARSLCTPLSLWAIAFALDDWKNNLRSLTGCGLAIALAAAFHPLMAGYALGLILVLRASQSHRRILLLTALALLTFTAAAILQARAPAESVAVVLAAKSRYYWFLSQWHWYEFLGLIGPIVVLLVLRYGSRVGLTDAMLCNAAILYGCFAVGLTCVLAHQDYQAHFVARLQPLRAFLSIHLVMFLLLGAFVQQLFERSVRSSRFMRFAICPILLVVALTMFLAQCSEFPSSAHVELPWRFRESRNAWVRAFLWCRENSPRNALFALNANYITTPGEDAQTFRAVAQRSVLPDFSKDGGEAAITPRLTDDWLAGFTAQLDLDERTAPQLRAHLIPYEVDWVILRADSPAALSCPYKNESIKVCRLLP